MLQAADRTPRPLPVQVTASSMTTEQAQGAGVQTLVGAFTTYVAAGQPRATRIRRIAELVDDAYLPPGEVPSLNRTAGERTWARGFVAAGAIVDGELTDEVDGGVDSRPAGQHEMECGANAALTLIWQAAWQQHSCCFDDRCAPDQRPGGDLAGSGVGEQRADVKQQRSVHGPLAQPTPSPDRHARRHHGSARAVDRDREGAAHLAHSCVAQPAEPVEQHTDRHTLDGVEVDCRTTRYRVIAGLEHHFADESSNRRRAWSNQSPAMPRYHCVTGKYDDRTPADLGHLAPPDLATGRQSAHDAAAARLNDARSPHSSGSSIGCSS